MVAQFWEPIGATSYLKKPKFGTFAVPVISTVPVTVAPASGAVIIIWSGIQPLIPLGTDCVTGESAAWVACSGDKVSAGVRSRSSVGVARISVAGSEGAMNVATKNSTNTRIRIRNAAP